MLYNVGVCVCASFYKSTGQLAFDHSVMMLFLVSFAARLKPGVLRDGSVFSKGQECGDGPASFQSLAHAEEPWRHLYAWSSYCQAQTSGCPSYTCEGIGTVYDLWICYEGVGRSTERELHKGECCLFVCLFVGSSLQLFTKLWFIIFLAEQAYCSHSLSVRPSSFLPSCRQLIKYRLVLYDVGKCYSILCAVQDSNPWPLDYQARFIPTWPWRHPRDLENHYMVYVMVMTTEKATKLGHD